MSDTGDVGALVILLQAETAQFRDDLGKVQKDLDDLANKGKNAGDKLDYSMLNARGSMMIIEQITGTRLPRALNTLLASIGPIGAAFSTMLPIIGVAAAIAVVLKLVTAHEKLSAAIRKGQSEIASLDISEDSTAKSMQLANMEIQDQINKLQGGIDTNHLAEALVKTAIAADKLAGKMLTDFTAIDEKLTDSTDIANSYWNAFYDNLGAIANGGATGLAFTLAQAQGWRKATKEVFAATEAIDKNSIAWTKSASGTKEQAAAQATLEKSLNDYITKAKEAQNYLNPDSNEADHKAWLNLEQGIHHASGSLKELAAQAKLTNSELKLGGLEDKQAGLKANTDLVKIAVKGNEALIESNRKLAQSNADAELGKDKDSSKTIEANLAAEITAINAKRDADINADNALLAEKEKLYKSESAQSKEGTHEREKLDAEYANDVKINAAAIKAVKADAENEITSKTREAAAERAHIHQEELRTDLENTKANTAAKIESIKSAASADLNQVKDKEDMGGFASKTAAIQAYISVLESEKAALTLLHNEEETQLKNDIKLAQAAYEAAKGTEKEGEAYRNLSTAQNTLNASAAKFQQETTGLTNQVNQQGLAVVKLQHTWQQYFNEMRQNLPTMGQAIRVNLQNSIDQFTKAFSDDLGKSIVQGKSFKQSMIQLAGQLGTQLVSMLIEQEAKKLEIKMAAAARDMAQHLGLAAKKKAVDSAAAASEAAQLSARNATTMAANKLLTASYIDVAAAAAAAAAGPGAIAAATAVKAALTPMLAFEQGGKIPGAGAVPIIGHGGEYVIDRRLTEKLEKQTTSSGDTVVHNHYSPHISAIDSDGVEGMLKKHAAVFQRQVASTIRKLNR